MKKFFTLTFVALILFTNSNAQRSCGAMEHLDRIILENPSVLQTREQIEEFTQSYINNNDPENGNRAVITIPVVVHVVYNTSAQNISDAQIQSQLTVLNNDFRKLNSDWTNTPSAFQSLVADAEVQFCLAQRDPNGNATSGIIRKSTSVTSFSTNDAVKKSSTGGSDAWPTSSYLNIWVCSLSGGVLGYAQFPGGPAATDGVVCTNTGFGTTGTATAPFNKGRTATHEVGHWLNLYHIWGDDGTGCTGSDQCGDTPNSGGPNYNCPTFPKASCSNGSNGDMFMNYMDYTNDACMYMFTAGQKARMQALFATGGFRASLINSLGCQAVTGGGTTCGVPSSLSATSITNNSAVLSWSAVTGATSYNLQYKTATATTWSTSSITSTSANFTGLAASTTYNFQVQAVCSGGNSTYSPVASFTTLSSTTTCSDIYESNNSLSAAKSIAVNSNINATIGSSTDNDYFKFSTTTTLKNIRVTLDNLPGDYDLRLYSSTGSLLGTSQNGGTTSETLKYNNAKAGTYYARVSGYNGAFNASTCYRLNASISSTAFKLGEEEVNDIGKPITDLDINIYPNPTTGSATLDMFFGEKMDHVNIRVFNMVGALISETELQVAEGAMPINIDVSNQPNGMYHVIIITPNGTDARKLILNK